MWILEKELGKDKNAIIIFAKLITSLLITENTLSTKQNQANQVG